jgi:hypothetical protein
MRVIRDADSVAQVSDPDVRQLIQRRIRDLTESGDYELADLAFFIVVEPGDPLSALDAQLGFPVLCNRWDGTRYDEPAFTRSWEILEESAGCFEIVFVLSDDGFGVEIFVPKCEGIDPDLLAMCARFAVPALQGDA